VDISQAVSGSTVRLVASGAVTTGTARIDAGADLTISSTTSRVTTGSGGISAGTVRIEGAQSVGSIAPITSRGAVVIASTSSITSVLGSVTAAGDLTIRGIAVNVNGNQTTTGSGSITVSTSGSYSGSGALNSAGAVSITAAGTTVGAAMSSATDLTIVSSSLTVTRNLTSSLGEIHLKSSDNIILQAGSSTSSTTRIQTTGGDITLQSDSDGSNDGYVWIQNFANITSGAGPGNILISGGTTPSSGFATAASGDGDKRAGVQFGAYASNVPGYADGITVSAGTGNVTIRGKAIGNSAGRGILMTLASTSSNSSSITGQNVTLVGNSEGASGTTWYGVEVGYTSDQVANSTKATLNATGTLSVTGASSNYDGIVSFGNFEFIGNRIVLNGTGPRQPIRLGYATENVGSLATRIAAGNGGFSYTATKTGVSNSDGPLFKPASFTSSGPVAFVYDMGSASGQLAIDSALSVTNSDVTVRSNDVSLGGSINAGTGAVKFEPFTSSRSISLGTDQSGELSLDATELGKITATTLRFETGSNTTVRSNLTFTSKVSELVIRAGGNVSAALNLAVVVGKLGIEAGGNITWPGTGHNAAVIALNAGASGTISFGQSANYSVAAVDGIDPEFGVATKFVLSNVDRTNTVDRFMGVTFNPPPATNPPPPAVVLKDKFNNDLAANNLSASSYVVRASMTATRTDSGTLSFVGGTPTTQGGTSTFTSLRVDNGTGLVAIRFTAVSPTGTSLVDAATNQTSTSINYTIRAGEPASIDLVLSATTTRAGLTGLSPTATLKDSTGGTLD
jgi:hypothetical protein